MAQNNSTAVMDVDTVEKEKKMKVKKSEMLKLNKFIYEVLKKVHPDIAISAGAVELMNTILTDMMLKLAQKASKHNKIRHKNSPLVEPDISAAVREVFPEDMAGLALLSALKSVIRMNVEDICHGITKM
ncbi:putative transcription factor Hap3/NF-YB family [Medicago truncatula]|uniref:Putative transcription factor Hap3/NF-YB family n=1 Tax=Medicago truncatula TaxID=3880 RepID=A0A396IK01_MEDTR|nr:putative transcription factor Hap3/NF-YB family [Medicago truncatula]